MAEPVRRSGRSIRNAVVGVASLTVLIVAAVPALLRSQSANSLPTQVPTFEVVSIRPSAAQGPMGSQNRPDGGFSMTRSPVTVLLQRAFPSTLQIYTVGLPEWAATDRYDIIAVPPPGASAEDRPTMAWALLTDRFKLLAHIEERDQPVYELVRARTDGQLGPSIRPSPLDCEAFLARQRAEAGAPRTGGQPPAPSLGSSQNVCMLRSEYFGGPGGDRIEGDATMATLSSAIASNTLREVVDKTGLDGFFRLALVFNRNAALKPDGPPPTGAAPIIFTAIQEQLGLRLVSARVPRQTLVIERLEKPAPN